MQDRIALIADNSNEYVQYLLKIWENNDVAVLIDWRIPYDTIESILNETNIAYCYADKHHFIQLREYHNNVEEIISHSNKAMILDKSLYNYKENYSQQDAVIFFSSGTTGKSKGIILSHFAINTNADHIIEYMSLKDDDVIYITKTLAHSSTFVGELLVGLKSNIQVIISPTIIPLSHTLNNINRYKVTILCLNPTLLYLYSKWLEKNLFEFETLHTIYVSGSILKDNILSNALQCFNNISIFNMYGLTECGPRVTVQNKKSINKFGSVGSAIQDTYIRVLDFNGKLVPNKSIGIVYVKTLTIMKGYINTPEKQSLKDGYWCTGDLGYIDDEGDLFIVGRKDNMIISSSHNIYPEEIEYIINADKEIVDNIIFGVDDELYGQKIICLYTSSKDKNKDLLKLCQQSLATYEIPHEFIKVKNLPRTFNGKISRVASKIIYKNLRK